MKKNNHIVLTSINELNVLKAYQENLSLNGHLESTKIWVVGDKKTPSSVSLLCSSLTDEGLETEYLDIHTQDEWGLNCPEFYSCIPYNNETRRNIGYLHALEDGCERLISIDDDNWPTDDDFIGGHSCTGKKWDNDLISDPSGFYNVCEHLKFEPARPIFPRGYPFSIRGKINNPFPKNSHGTRYIGVMAGLWLGEPDIDATTWLNGKVNSIAYRGPDQFVLDQNTWSPINTQNTCVVRELIPAFLCIPMGWDVPGGKIQRYGDIWGGYILQALIQETKYNIAFGKPLVDHRRNPHDYIEDLRHEFWGMILTDWLLDLLRRDFHPVENNMCSRVEELSDFFISTAVVNTPSWCTPEMKAFIRYTAKTLELWSAICNKMVD